MEKHGRIDCGTPFTEEGCICRRATDEDLARGVFHPGSLGSGRVHITHCGVRPIIKVEIK